MIQKYIICEFDDVIGHVYVDQKVRSIKIGNGFTIEGDAVSEKRFKLSIAKKYEKKSKIYYLDTPQINKDRFGDTTYAWGCL